MSKLSHYTPVRPTVAIRSSQTHDALTGNLAPGYSLEPKSELFLFAISNMVGEANFYESAGGRDERFRNLVAQVTKEDPDWILRFIPYLRNEMFMRSASIVMAVEYVIAGGPHGRKAIASAIHRADEPGEVLGYYRSRVGRGVPQPIKRGIADAVQRLYTERNVIRYKDRGAYKIADVLRIAHPKPSGPWQSELFQYVLGKYEDAGANLEMVRLYSNLMHLPVDQRRDVIVNEPHRLDEAGMTWEAVAGWLQGPMDAKVWEALIPNMGYMALIRNLRNFDEAGISDEAKAKVNARIADPEEVARSMQFPFRFYSAYKASSSLTYAAALEKALELTTQNIPVLPGRTLILSDSSGSMAGSNYSKRGSLSYATQALLFGAALGKKNVGSVDLYEYDSRVHERIDLRQPLLRIVDRNPMGGATYTHAAIDQTFKDHDRIVVLTDGQASDSDDSIRHITVPIYTFNVAGYAVSDRASGKDGRYIFGGGLTDAAFKLIPLLEAGKSGNWPF